MLTTERMDDFAQACCKAFTQNRTPEYALFYLNHFEDIGQINLEKEKELVKEALSADLQDLEEPIMIVEKKLKETRTEKEQKLDLLYIEIKEIIKSLKDSGGVYFTRHKEKIRFFLELFKENMSDDLYNELDKLLDDRIYFYQDLDQIREDLWSMFNKLCIEWEAK